MRRITLLLVLLALLGGLAGCGGSGSSGFDITAGENAVIEEVVASGECGSSGPLVICPAGQRPETTPGHPAPTPEGGRDVELDVPASEALPCAQAQGEDGCVFVLSFAASGLPPGAAYHTAVRTVDPQGPWIVGERAERNGPSFAAAVDVPAGAGTVQLAVLVLTDGDDVTPGPVNTLGETRASFAFVSDVLSLARPF